MPLIIQSGDRRVTFTIYTERVDRFFRGASGEVDQLTESTAKAIVKAAAGKVGTVYSGDHGGTKLKNSGSIARASQRGDWKVIFRHRAAEVHYSGIDHAYQMPRKASGVYYRETGHGPTSPYHDNSKGQLRGRKRRGKFGPTKGPINRKPVKGNPYIAKGARALGLVVAEGPILEGGKDGGRAPGVIRIPKSFA